MASKMPAACDENEEPVTIAFAEQNKNKMTLHCEFCTAGVSFVNAYSRQVGENTVVVKPFFRLIRGQSHSEDCRYNISGQLAIIARESDGDILTAIENGRYELRLLAVKKALDQIRAAAEQKNNPDKMRPLGGAKEKKYSDAETTLGSYINSAKRVLKVRAICEDHSGIEDVLDLVFDGTHVSWSDFYFELEDYFRCYRQMKNSTVEMPVAIQGTVDSVKPVNDSCSVLNLKSFYRKTDNSDVTEAACVSIWSPDLKAFSDFNPGEEVIAFGLWKPQDEKPKNRYVNFEMRLWPVTKSQLCHVQPA